MNIWKVLAVSMLLFVSFCADSQSVVANSWGRAVYRGIVVGKSTRDDVIRILGEPKLVGNAAESEPPIRMYAFDVVDPVKGRLEVYFRASSAKSVG
jgi:hypothetical protein